MLFNLVYTDRFFLFVSKNGELNISVNIFCIFILPSLIYNESVFQGILKCMFALVSMTQ